MAKNYLYLYTLIAIFLVFNVYGVTYNWVRPVSDSVTQINISSYNITSLSFNQYLNTTYNFSARSINTSVINATYGGFNTTRHEIIFVTDKVDTKKLYADDGFIDNMGFYGVEFFRAMHLNRPQGYYAFAILNISVTTGDITFGYQNNKSIVISENTSNGVNYPITLIGDTTINGTLFVNNSINTISNISQSGQDINSTIRHIIQQNLTGVPISDGEGETHNQYLNKSMTIDVNFSKVYLNQTKIIDNLTILTKAGAVSLQTNAEDGNVGIGTAPSSSYKLYVSGTAFVSSTFYMATNQKFIFNSPLQNYFHGTGGNNELIFGTGSKGESFRIANYTVNVNESLTVGKNLTVAGLEINATIKDIIGRNFSSEVGNQGIQYNQYLNTTAPNLTIAGMDINLTIKKIIDEQAINRSITDSFIPYWDDSAQGLKNTIIQWDKTNQIKTIAPSDTDVIYYFDNTNPRNLNYSTRSSFNITWYNQDVEYRISFYPTSKDLLGTHIFSRPNAIGSGKYGTCIGAPSCVDLGYDFYTTNNVLLDGQVCFGDSSSCCDSSGSCTFGSTSSADMLITDGAIQSCDGGCPPGALSTDGDSFAENRILVATETVGELSDTANTISLTAPANGQDGLGCWNTQNVNFNCTYTTGVRVSATNYQKNRNQFIIEHINNETVNYDFKVNNKVVTQIDKGGNYYTTGNHTSYGELWNYSSVAYPVTISLAMTYYNITGLLCTGINYGFTCGTNKLTVNNINHMGTYKVDFSISFTGTASNDYDFVVGINGIPEIKCHAHRKIGTGGDIGNAGGTCLTRLNNNDIITLMVEDETAGNDINIHSVNLNLIKIAGS